MKELKRNKGVIKLQRSILDTLELDALKWLFGNFYPVHIECNNFTDELIYYGYSELFDLCSELEVAPNYEVIVTTSEKGVVSYKFKKLI